MSTSYDLYCLKCRKPFGFGQTSIDAFTSLRTAMQVLDASQAFVILARAHRDLGESLEIVAPSLDVQVEVRIAGTYGMPGVLEHRTHLASWGVVDGYGHLYDRSGKQVGERPYEEEP